MLAGSITSHKRVGLVPIEVGPHISAALAAGCADKARVSRYAPDPLAALEAVGVRFFSE